jgi:hypothetical protein
VDLIENEGINDLDLPFYLIGAAFKLSCWQQIANIDFDSLNDGPCRSCRLLLLLWYIGILIAEKR